MSQNKPVEFSVDGLKLRGRLHVPGVSRPPLVIGSHGLFSTRRSPKQLALAEACVASDMAFFRFDHRGCGDSDGDDRDRASLEGRRRDLDAAIHWLAETDAFGSRIGVFGSSFGGAAGIALAAHRTIDALVTFAAPVRSRTLAADAHIRVPPVFDIGGVLDRVRTIFVVHGDADTVVPISDAEEIHRQAASPKRLWIQRGGDHRMSDPAHQREFVTRAAAWFNEHLKRNG